MTFLFNYYNSYTTTKMVSEEDKQKYKSIIGTEYGSMAKRFFDRRTANVAPTKLGVGVKRKTKRRHRRRN